jgi:hypothetical protein
MRRSAPLPYCLRGVAQLRRDKGEAFDYSLRHRTGLFLESKFVEIFIVWLTVLDLVCVGVEIGINSRYLCFNGIPVTPLEAGHEVTPGHENVFRIQEGYRRLSYLDSDVLGLSSETRQLSEVTTAEHEEGEEEHEEEVYQLCEPEEAHFTETIYEIAHVTSITILIIMAWEQALKVIVHPHEMLFNPFNVLDIFVTYTSLIVDLVLLFEGGGTFDLLLECAGFLIFLRLWRVVRIIHGLFEEYRGTRDIIVENAEITKRHVAKIKRLQALCRAHGIQLSSDLAREPLVKDDFNIDDVPFADEVGTIFGCPPTEEEEDAVPLSTRQ